MTSNNIFTLFIIIVLTICFNLCVVTFMGCKQKNSDSASTSAQQMYDDTICDKQILDSGKNNFKQEQSMSTHSNSINFELIQQHRNLIKEKKYKEALSLTEIFVSEKTKILAKEHPELPSEHIRLQYLSVTYFTVYLLLDRAEDALKKYEEIISQFPKELYENTRHIIFYNRLLLLSRLNRIDDFINECNNLINRHSPDMVDYWFGYIYGALGYAIKQDYKKAEQYLSSGKYYFNNISKNDIDNIGLLRITEKFLEFVELFLTHLQDEGELKPVKVQPTITETSDGNLEIMSELSFEVVSKKTGEPLTEEEFDEIMKKHQSEKEQERQKKLQEEDPFLKELRSKSQ
jgi:tetratricopeptide (TPR) repeat protein